MALSNPSDKSYPKALETLIYNVKTIINFNETENRFDYSNFLFTEDPSIDSTFLNIPRKFFHHQVVIRYLLVVLLDIEEIALPFLKLWTTIARPTIEFFNVQYTTKTLENGVLRIISAVQPIIDRWFTIRRPTITTATTTTTTITTTTGTTGTAGTAIVFYKNFHDDIFILQQKNYQILSRYLPTLVFPISHHFEKTLPVQPQEIYDPSLLWKKFFNYTTDKTVSFGTAMNFDQLFVNIFKNVIDNVTDVMIDEIVVDDKIKGTKEIMLHKETAKAKTYTSEKLITVDARNPSVEKEISQQLYDLYYPYESKTEKNEKLEFLKFKRYLQGIFNRNNDLFLKDQQRIAMFCWLDISFVLMENIEYPLKYLYLTASK